MKIVTGLSVRLRIIKFFFDCDLKSAEAQRSADRYRRKGNQPASPPHPPLVRGIMKRQKFPPRHMDNLPDLDGVVIPTHSHPDGVYIRRTLSNRRFVRCHGANMRPPFRQRKEIFEDFESTSQANAGCRSSYVGLTRNPGCSCGNAVVNPRPDDTAGPADRSQSRSQ